MSDADSQPVSIAPEEWAHIEIFGRRSHWGRISEVERYGTKLLRIDIPTDDPEVFETFLYGGAAVFSCTICTEETARTYITRARRYAIRPRSLLGPDEDDVGDGDDKE